MQIPIPTDEDLLCRLANYEDNFTERKTSSDSRDWVKTVVAFANSLPVGHPGVLFVGVKNDGTPEVDINLDSLQKTFSEKMNAAYPPIYYLPHVLNYQGIRVLAVIVPGSEMRPHFTGQSYIREGSQNIKASEKQFNELIAQRNSKAYEILKWKGKSVKLSYTRPGNTRPSRFGPVRVLDCNQFYVTLESDGALSAIPLKRLDISFDPVNEVLELERRGA